MLNFCCASRINFLRMAVKNSTKAIKCYKNGNKNWLKDDVQAVSA